MARFVQLFVVCAVLGVAYCHPFGFGAGLGYNSHTNAGADVVAQAGAEKDYGASAKGKGFFDWIGALTGHGYVGDLGLKSTLGSTIGGGVKSKGIAGTNASGNEDGAEAHAGANGKLDKEAHANVFGNIDALDPEEIKRMENRNKIMLCDDSEEQGYGARPGGW